MELSYQLVTNVVGYHCVVFALQFMDLFYHATDRTLKLLATSN
jgi:hypothetical protein